MQDPVINVYPPAGSPGWLVPVIAGGFLLLGGVLTFWYSSIQEKRRLRHDLDTRWDSELRSYVADYVAIADKIDDFVVSLNALVARVRTRFYWHRRNVNDISANESPPSTLHNMLGPVYRLLRMTHMPRRGFKQLEKDTDDLVRALVQLQLLAPKEIVDHAEHLYGTTIVWLKSAGSDSDYSEACKAEFLSARSALIDGTRRFLFDFERGVRSRFPE